LSAKDRRKIFESAVPVGRQNLTTEPRSITENLLGKMTTEKANKIEMELLVKRYSAPSPISW
jgi:hypothetical protein